MSTLEYIKNNLDPDTFIDLSEMSTEELVDILWDYLPLDKQELFIRMYEEEVTDGD